MRREIERAVRILREGGLVAFPTETVYGLGANARDPLAALKIFAAKGRPIGHPLIVHLPSVEQIEAWAYVTDTARALTARFWPGPLTIILRKRDGVPGIVTGDQDTIGLRMPDHPIARELLLAFGDGIAAPSANKFGKVSPTTAAHVREELGDAVDLVLDGGAARVGIESTIVDLSGDMPRLLRPGAVSREDIEALTGEVAIGGETRAPGTHASHYAPRAELRIVRDAGAEAARVIAEGRRAVVLGARSYGGLPLIDLPDDPELRAHRLYAALREVDERGFDVAIVELGADESGLSIAIADRLRRASTRSD